jgi:DnaJ-class molecular chaperone with C-terminal Zn finger domain
MRSSTRATHYEILGVPPNVSQAEIKRAYRQLVKTKHPDLAYKDKADEELESETQLMMVINEAYSVLIDEEKRADYDATLHSRFSTGIPKHAQDSLDEERAREKFLRHVFNPLKRSIAVILKKYKANLSKLAQDIYDDELLNDFGEYVEEIEDTLRKASQGFTDNPPPLTMIPAVQWMRHAIAQAADGLDELNFFLNNYDYDHLAMADNLFKIALEHIVKASSLAKSC